MAQISDLISNDSIRGLHEFFNRQVDEKQITESYTKGLANELKKTFGNLAVRDNGSSVSVAYRILNDANNENVGFYDLKQAFARSSKAKPTKDGGWYIRIPISNRATEYRQAFGRKLWDTISHTEFGTTSSADENIARFQKILSNAGGVNSSPIAYQWKSTSVTRERFGSSATRGQYISFRTVSDKSDPNSWVTSKSGMNAKINQETENEQQAQEVAKVVQQAIRQIIDRYNKAGEIS